MSIYRQGFEAGVKDQQEDNIPHENAGEQAASAFAQAETLGEPLCAPEQESLYWLGYYHGRAFGSTGQLPEGLNNQIKDN